ncbi:MAG: toll/interleukin-1 receptor domain-containing protein [Bacteroidales bacterium]|nr:toll/interleukin-1 receptor domain-containing protein [Bacteroidales bacterium]
MAQVFISYSKRDYIDEDGQVIGGSVVDRIIKTLSDNGISYWIDREGLDVGVTYADTISKSIKECDTFLFLSSQNANSSPWTLREISTAIDFGKTVLPVKMDNSRYADSVALYLASVQYIDWPELGAEESLRRIVSRIKGGSTGSFRQFKKERIPKFTAGALYAGLIFLTGVYACLTYLFLWAKALRSSEIMGGLAGYVAEFGVLMSIYYIIRLLRLRRCLFILPTFITGIVFLAGMLLRDFDVMFSGILLFFGWLFILIACLTGMSGGNNILALMSKEQMILLPKDAENLLLVYLIFKAVIIVFSHYLGFPWSIQ